MPEKPIVNWEEQQAKKSAAKGETVPAKRPVTKAEAAPAENSVVQAADKPIKKPVAQAEAAAAPAAHSTLQTFVATQEAKDKASTNRIIAVILWVLGLGCEAAVIYFLLKGTFNLHNTLSWVILIGLLVADLILVVVGSMLWKKANRLDPASKKEKLRFFVQNQLGAIIAIIAFLPVVIVIFTDKNLEGKQKGVLGAVACVALVAAVLLGINFNPPSVEQYSEQANEVVALTGQNLVYFTTYGSVYHLYSDCTYLTRATTGTVYSGTVQDAHAQSSAITESTLCSVCKARAEAARGISLAPDASASPAAAETPAA
ncbi:MAG: hypothetical protein FWC62_01730 [Firmicutes bacterium]|nr:hypothetical protein [Bacillota bacterium]